MSARQLLGFSCESVRGLTAVVGENLVGLHGHSALSAARYDASCAPNPESSPWHTILRGLCSKGSPQQIAGKLPRTNKIAIPGLRVVLAKPMSVLHEAIYCGVHAMPRNTLRSKLVCLLSKGHKTRLILARSTVCKGVMPNMTNLSLSLPNVAARIVPDHWEGALIKGAMNSLSLGTLVERISRYVMLVKLDCNTAQDMLDGSKHRLKCIPASLRKIMTYD